MSALNALRLLVVILVLVIMGCSGGGDRSVSPEFPSENGLDADSEESSRILWGIWEARFDQDDIRVTVTPVRVSWFHFDITEMIIPPACDDCMEIAVISFDPVTRILSANVTLRNPYSISGRDVRGILFTNDVGHRLENPDDWTGLWDAPGGGTINPFIAFAKSETNRVFSGDSEHTENYQVYIPLPPQYNAITFAVDASWPGNCKEPYAIDNFSQLGILYNVEGHSTTVEVYVRDWQSDVSKVTLVAPEITGQSFTAFTNVTGDKWQLELTNGTGAAPGEYNVRIIADSTNCPDLPLYDFVTVTIAEGIQPIVTGIFPDNEFSGTELNGAQIFGINFEGPGIQVKLKRTGEPDIVAANVQYQPTVFTCDISIPLSAAPGLYDVEVTNGTGISGVGENLFEVLVKIPSVYGVVPDHGATGANLIDAYVTGEYFQGPGIQVKLKMDGEPFIEAENVWYNEVTIVGFDINIPFDATLGMYDVEVTNGNMQSGTLETAFEVHGPVPDNPVDITPDWLNFRPEDICAEGDYAYIAGGHNGLSIWNISIPTSPVWVNKVSVGGEILCVDVSGGYAYCGAMDDGLYVIDIDPPESASHAGYLGTGGWGYGITVVGNTVYLADGANDLYIIDVTTPETPSLLKAVSVPGSAYDVVVEGGYAYIAAGISDLQIVDVEPPATASVVDSVSFAGGGYDVALQGEYAYMATSGYVVIVDVDPIGSSAEVNNFTTPGSAWGVVVSGDYAYICDGMGGLAIADVNPVGSASVVHSVAMHGYPQRLSIVGNYAYVADEITGLYVVDISTPESASLSEWLPTAGQPQSIAYGNDLVYIANSLSGVMAYDVTTPALPVYAAITDTDEAYCIDVVDGYAYVGDWEDQSGHTHLRILDVDPVESMNVANSVEANSSPFGVVYRDGYAYMAEQNAGLNIYDVDPVGSAQHVKMVSILDQVTDIAVDGGYAYISGYDMALHIVDIDPIADAYVVKWLDPDFHGTGVDVQDGYAYVSEDWGYNLLIIDVDPPETASVEKTVFVDGSPRDVVVSGGYAYIADGYQGLKIVDVEPVADASVIASVDTPGLAKGIVLADNLAFIAEQYSGWRIIQLW